MRSQFSSTLPINVINAAVSADRAVLDNQTGIKFEFFELAPWEARGKLMGRLGRKVIENARGTRVCGEEVLPLS